MSAKTSGRKLLSPATIVDSILAFDFRGDAKAMGILDERR